MKFVKKEKYMNDLLNSKIKDEKYVYQGGSSNRLYLKGNSMDFKEELPFMEKDCDVKFKANGFKFNFRVCCILEKEDGTFLVQQKKGESSFKLPGGRVRIAEGTFFALLREIKEETGYEIKNKVRLVSITENFFKYHKEKQTQYTYVHEILYVYKTKVGSDMQIQDGQCAHDKDNIVFYWKKKDEIDSLKLVPKQIKEVVLDEKNTFKPFYIQDL